MIRTMDSFTGTMVSLRIKIPSRYTTRTTTRIPRFCHFTDHSICLSSFAHVGGLSDRFCRFCTCVYRYRIGSAHSICHHVGDLSDKFRRFCTCVYRYRIDSAVFAHVSCLYSSAVFAHYTACGLCIDIVSGIDSAVFAHVGDLSDRFRHFCTCQQLIQLRRFCTCVYRYRIGSAHSIDLYSYRMSVIDSAVFAHVCIDIG